MPDFKMRGLPSKAPDLILDMDEEGWAFTQGISFPPYPRKWERCFRQDIRGGMMFVWDGTYWLSEDRFTVQIGGEGLTVDGMVARPAIPNDYQVYVERIDGRAYVVLPNDASNWWSVTLFSVPMVGANTNISSAPTSTIPAQQFYPLTFQGSPPPFLVPTTAVQFYGYVGKVGAPGPIYVQMLVTFRLRAG